MKIDNQNNSDDAVTIIKSEDRKGLVWLAIGEDKRSRHAHLDPSEAKAIAYALLSYAEQVCPPNSDDTKTGMSDKDKETWSKL